MASTLSIILLTFLFFQICLLSVQAQDNGNVEYYPTRKKGMTVYGSVYCPSTGAAVSGVDVSLMCPIDGGDMPYSVDNTTDSSGFFNITQSLYDLEVTDYTQPCIVAIHLPTTKGNCADFYTARKSELWSDLRYIGSVETANWGSVEKQLAQSWETYYADDNPKYYPEPPVPSEYRRPAPPVATFPSVSPSPMQDTPSVSPSPVQEPVEPPQVSRGLPQAPDNSPQVSLSPSQADVESPEYSYSSDDYYSPSPPVQSQDNYSYGYDYDYYYPTRKMGISAHGTVLCPTGGHGVPDMEMSLMCYIDGDTFHSYAKNTTDSDGRFNVTASLRDLRGSDYTTQCYIEFHIPTTRGNCVDYHNYADAYVWSFFDNEGTFETANWGWVEKKIAQNWTIWVNDFGRNGPPSSPSDESYNWSPSPMQSTPAESPQVSLGPTQDYVVYPPVSSSPSQSIVESPQVSPTPMQTPVESTPSPSLTQAPIGSPSMSPSTRPEQAPAVAPVVSSSPTPAPAKATSNRAGISAYGNVYCSATGNKSKKRAAGLDVKLNCSIDSTKSLTVGHTTTNSAGFFNITLPSSDLTAFSPKPNCYVYFDVPTEDGNCPIFHTAAKSVIRSDFKVVRTEQTAAYGLVVREKAKRWYIVKSK